MLRDRYHFRGINNKNHKRCTHRRQRSTAAATHNHSEQCQEGNDRVTYPLITLWPVVASTIAPLTDRNGTAFDSSKQG